MEGKWLTNNREQTIKKLGKNGRINIQRSNFMNTRKERWGVNYSTLSISNFSSNHEPNQK